MSVFILMSSYLLEGIIASAILGFPCPTSPCIAGRMYLWLALMQFPVMLYGFFCYNSSLYHLCPLYHCRHRPQAPGFLGISVSIYFDITRTRPFCTAKSLVMQNKTHLMRLQDFCREFFDKPVPLYTF